MVKMGVLRIFDDNTFYEQDRVQLFMVLAKFPKLREGEFSKDQAHFFLVAF